MNQATDKTVASLLRESTRLLKDSSDSARLDAELLLAHALGWQRVRLYGDSATAVRPEIAERFERLVQERRAGRPVAQLVGEREFWSLSLKVTADTLVPRAETELLVECALNRIPEDSVGPLLDLGTGSGAIALALASERPRAKIVATDISEPALAVARYNASTLNPDRIDFRFGDWFRPVEGELFAAVVCNPPYVTDQEWMLRKYELGYEPAQALRGGRSGLYALRRIIEEAPPHLLPGGWLLVEHGFRQGPVIANLFQATGFENISTYRDLPGRPRVTEGLWPDQHE
ncbi:MAG: peptide chain release factor N(5)-glutamine methyltransferase [Gammaproteobacteria bacterium]|nr:peptide chain release factor N(5)-glutamine methyltransferase [Gammaproteobacteria bacterium]